MGMLAGRGTLATVFAPRPSTGVAEETVQTPLYGRADALPAGSTPTSEADIVTSRRKVVTDAVRQAYSPA
jgi:hypothetical protein